MSGPAKLPNIMVVGCGAVTERGYLPALAAAGVTPAVLVDTDLARAGALAARVGAPRVATDYAATLDGIDAAVVALPHALHAPVSVELLRRGIHVLVEKPMALSTAECAAMNEAAATGGAVLAVGLLRRHLRALRWMKGSIDDGVFGPIGSVEVEEGAPYNWPVVSDFFFRRGQAGGGVLVDTGSHTLDTLLWWFGEVARVDYRDDANGGVESECEIGLEFVSGVRATVALSRVRRLRNTAVVRGRRGLVEVRLHANELRAHPRKLLAGRGAEGAGDALPKQTFDDLFAAEVKDWLGAIAVSGRAAVDGREGARGVALIERCYAQRRDLVRGWVSVSQPVRSRPAPVARSLVTGASGFIGGRLVELLCADGETDARVVVRRFAGAARLARNPVALLGGDLTDPACADRAVAGRDVVFHCAHDFSRPEANLVAAGNLAEACLRHGVRRLVYLSSVAVHEPLPDGDLVEDTPWPPCEQPYTVAKRSVESFLAARWRESGLPVVVLRPTVVYGPFCRPWTLEPIRLLRSSRIVLPDGAGLCNAVYVDDVAAAMVLAAEVEGVEGETFLVSGTRPVTWREFYRCFERMLGVRGVVTLPADEIDRLRRQGEAGVDVRAAALDVHRVTRWRAGRLIADAVRHTIGNPRWERFKSRMPAPLHLPTPQWSAFYRARPRVRIDKARERLGYEPRWDLEAGMARVAEYVRWARL